MTRAEKQLRNQEILRRCMRGEKFKTVAHSYNLAPNTVYMICRGICDARSVKAQRNPEMAARALKGEPLKSIAHDYGISWSRVQRIVAPYRIAAGIRRKPRNMKIEGNAHGHAPLCSTSR